jgi:hypothetical protein
MKDNDIDYKLGFWRGVLISAAIMKLLMDVVL